MFVFAATSRKARVANVLLLWLASFTAQVTGADADECRLSDASGSYDLRGLQRKEDYAVKNFDNEEIYYLNFCGPITRTTWAVPSPGMIGGYTEGAHGGISLGRYNTTLSRTSGALAFTYTAGSTCSSGGQRGIVVNLECDNSWGGTRGPVLVGIVDECFYAFNFRTPHACPISFVSSVGSILWVFFSFIIIAIGVSLASAVAYNRLVLHRRGRDQFPSADKIKEVLEFVRDIAGIAAIYLFDLLQAAAKPILTFLRRQPSGGYSNVDYTRGAWSRSAQSSFQRVPTEAPPPPQKDVNVAVDILGDDEEEGSEDEGEGPGKTHQPFKDDVEAQK